MSVEMENVNTGTNPETTPEITNESDAASKAKSKRASRPKSAGSKVMSDQEIDAQVKRMGQEVASMPRVAVRLPINPLDDPKDQVQFVGINGYEFWIPRGVTVELPECVIEILKQVEVL